MKATMIAILALVSFANADTWTKSVNKCKNNLSTMLQLRDGRLLVFSPDIDGIVSIWSPDQYGSYENGTCARGADMPPEYGPRAFGSVVATNGNVYVFGGEYNKGSQGEVWVNLAAMYTPDAGAGSWQMISTPPGWKHIGDAVSLLLPNGKIMQFSCCDRRTAIYDTKTGTWQATAQLLTSNHEFTPVLLQDGRVFVVDTTSNFMCGLSPMGTEVYDPSTDTWQCGPPTPIKLYGAPDYETGPPTVLPNGSLYVGAGQPEGSVILGADTMQWSLGPVWPGYHQDEIPMALLPDGRILAAWRTLDGNICQFGTYDMVSAKLTATANPIACPSRGQETGSFRMTVLPTGQVALSHINHWLEFYNSDNKPLTSASPSILALSSLALHSGQTYVLYGKQLNGVSQASMKDDDAQQATNYPLVQIIDQAGHVRYAKTHDDSYSGIQPGKISYTMFDVPADLSTGTYSIRIVANGLASVPLPVSVVQQRNY